MKTSIPTEEAEQTALFQWAELAIGQYPDLRLMYHIPNGGSRNKTEAAKLKGQGVKAGVPDICLPVPRGRWHGLYIEMKKQKGGRLSDSQRRWLHNLSAQGYKCFVCFGFEDARQTIIDYLEGKYE